MGQLKSSTLRHGSSWTQLQVRYWVLDNANKSSRELISRHCCHAISSFPFISARIGKVYVKPLPSGQLLELHIPVAGLLTRPFVLDAVIRWSIAGARGVVKA
jgi:hypothetical protein